MPFNQNLSSLRKSADMSQEELAEKLNVTRQAISKWENATSYPDIETVVKISDIFGVTTDSLLKDNEPKKQAQAAELPTPDDTLKYKAVFLIIVFVSGTLIFLSSFMFWGGLINPLLYFPAIFLMLVSGIAFTVMMRRHKKRADKNKTK